MNRKRKKLPVVLDFEEMEKLIKAPNTRYPTGLRAKAIMALMLNTGLRVSEVVNLKKADISLTKGALRVIDGKGGKDRDIPIPWAVTEILKAWKKIRPAGSTYFFTTIKSKKAGNRFDSKKGSKLSARYIQFMVARYAQKAGIAKSVTPHTLRHSYATEFIRRDGNPMVLKDILGHADIGTTQIYITLASRDVEKAMASWQAIV